MRKIFSGAKTSASEKLAYTLESQKTKNLVGIIIPALTGLAGLEYL